MAGYRVPAEMDSSSTAGTQRYDSSVPPYRANWSNHQHGMGTVPTPACTAISQGAPKRPIVNSHGDTRKMARLSASSSVINKPDANPTGGPNLGRPVTTTFRNHNWESQSSGTTVQSLSSYQNVYGTIAAPAHGGTASGQASDLFGSSAIPNGNENAGGAAYLPEHGGGLHQSSWQDVPTWTEDAVLTGLKGVPHGRVHPSDTPDSLDIDPWMEEDMIALLGDHGGSPEKKDTPPSSVLQGMDRDSRDGNEFDPSLQRSPPLTENRVSEQEGVAVAPMVDSPGVQGGLMDGDMDWGQVMASARPIADADSDYHGSIHQLQHSILNTPVALSRLPGDSMGVHSAQATVTPSVPFGASTATRAPTSQPPPERRLYPTSNVRDMARFTGLSDQTPTQVCFRLGEFINQASRSLRAYQTFTFELYARVTYSSRESLGKRQLFQFLDLFKDSPPYLPGTLVGWTNDGVLDKQSREFLHIGLGQAQMCRCVCRPRQDAKSAIGLSVTVLSIKTTDWDEIELTRSVICPLTRGRHA